MHTYFLLQLYVMRGVMADSVSDGASQVNPSHALRYNVYNMTDSYSRTMEFCLKLKDETHRHVQVEDQVGGYEDDAMDVVDVTSEADVSCYGCNEAREQTLNLICRTSEFLINAY